METQNPEPVPSTILENMVKGEHILSAVEVMQEKKRDIQYLTRAIERAKSSRVSVTLMLIAFSFIAVFLAIISGLGEILFRYLSFIENLTPVTLYLFLLIFLLLLSVIPNLIAKLRIGVLLKNYANLKNELAEISLAQPLLRLGYLQGQQIELTARAAKIDWVEERKRKYSDSLRKNLGKALAKLEEYKNSEDKPIVKSEEAAWDWEIMPQWDSIHFGLTQWAEIIEDEEERQDDERKWKVMSVAIAVLYLVVLLLAIPSFNVTNTVFGVPLPIIIWSAVGSLAAILYRFYKAERQIEFEAEFRWLIARPVIGIIMGTLAYLALFSGLLIFETVQADPSSPDTVAKTGQLAQYWIVAFLAGFSDKFYEKIIELLVGKLSTGNATAETKPPKNANSDETVSMGPPSSPAL